MSPHLYEMSSMSYKNTMLGHHGNSGANKQFICMLGEPCSGKSYNVKVSIDHLIDISNHSDRLKQMRKTSQFIKSETRAQIQERIKAAYHLVEVFGHAQTATNRNSSRVGKVIKLQYMVRFPKNPLPLCELAGLHIEPFCLDSTSIRRNVSFKESRSFHIFNDFLAAPNDFKAQVFRGFENIDTSTFVFTAFNEISLGSCRGVDPTERWKSTYDALIAMEIHGAIMIDLFRTLYCVLLLGNLTFSESIDGCGSMITSLEELATIAELLNIEATTLIKALTTKRIKVNGKEAKTLQLSSSGAKDLTEIFAQHIYMNVFEWLVKRMNGMNNESTVKVNATDKIASSFIGLIDMFGVESKSVNGFHQICINHASEVVQNKFNADVFESIIRESNEEGFSLGEIAYPDTSSSILEMFESTGGLIEQLDLLTSSNCSKEIDQVTYSFQMTIEKYPKVIRKVIHTEDEFVVEHFTGPVAYSYKNFFSRNMNKLSDDLASILNLSTNKVFLESSMINKSDISSNLLSNDSPPFLSRKCRNTSVFRGRWFKIQEQLKRLRCEMDEGTTRYIYCVNPNRYRKPDYFDLRYSSNQLKSAGIETACYLGRQVFPDRLLFPEFLDRFHLLVLRGRNEGRLMMHGKESELRKDIEVILNNMLKDLEVVRSDGSAALSYSLTNRKVIHTL